MAPSLGEGGAKSNRGLFFSPAKEFTQLLAKALDMLEAFCIQQQLW